MRLINQFTRTTSPFRPFSSSSRPPPSPPSISAALSVGHVLRGSRRFTERDLAQYSEVTGDYNPVHLDDESAKTVGGFERGRVVHGMLVASLFPSIIASSFVRCLSLSVSLRNFVEQPGAIYVSQNLKFKLPVYIEDEVSAELQTTHIREIKKRYIVKFTTKCFTNENQLVIDGEAMTIFLTHINTHNTIKRSTRANKSTSQYIKPTTPKISSQNCPLLKLEPQLFTSHKDLHQSISSNSELALSRLTHPIRFGFSTKIHTNIPSAQQTIFHHIHQTNKKNKTQTHIFIPSNNVKLK
ncbi:hypothetical protein LUZ60_002409 [Juncus effusus]|nr:hypothetical protein LUZ60_002409 [Juncus effusus]